MAARPAGARAFLKKTIRREETVARKDAGLEKPGWLVSYVAHPIEHVSTSTHMGDGFETR